jgi:hypothetical protein
MVNILQTNWKKTLELVSQNVLRLQCSNPVTQLLTVEQEGHLSPNVTDI